MNKWWILKRKDIDEFPVFRVPVEGGELQVDYHAGWDYYRAGGQKIKISTADVLEMFNTGDIDIYLEEMWP